MSGLDLGVLFGYLALLVGIGVWQRRRASASTEEYFVSGRTLPWYVAGTSMIASSFASDTPLLVSGLVREFGIWRNWVWWSNAISLILTVFFFSRLWRRAGVLTEVELTELRYSGTSAAALRGFKALYWGLLYNAFVAGAWAVTGLRKVFQVALDVEPTTAILVCGVIACAYSVLSGYWGVVATDCFQFVLALLGSIACAVYAVQAAGGWDAMLVAVPPEKLACIPAAGSTHWYWFLSLVMVNWWAWKNTDGGGLLVQRMASCRNERHAVWATLWYQVFHTALRGWPWIVVALASFAVVPDAALPFKLGVTPPVPDHEAAYAVMIRTVLPAGLRGLVIGWFLAEFMSSINTQTNWGSSLLVNDFYKRFVNPDATQAQSLAVARWSTVLVMAGALGTAFLSGDIQKSFDYVLQGTAAIGVVAALRWLWWRVNVWTEVTVMILSPLTTFVIYPMGIQKYVLPWLGIADNRMVLLVSTVLVGVGTALVVTWLTRPSEDRTLQEFYRRVRPPGPGWRRIAAQCPGVTCDLRLPRLLGLWLAGVLCVFGLMYAVYAILFGHRFGWGMASGALLLLAGIVRWTWNIEDPVLEHNAPPPGATEPPAAIPDRR